jgi:hypothetical protein
LTVLDFQDQTPEVDVREIEVPDILEAYLGSHARLIPGRHLNYLQDIIDEFLLRRLDYRENFRFDGFPDIVEGGSGGDETVPEMVQVGIHGEVVVGCPIAEMQARGNSKVGLY